MGRRRYSPGARAPGASARLATGCRVAEDFAPPHLATATASLTGRARQADRKPLARRIRRKAMRCSVRRGRVTAITATIVYSAVGGGFLDYSAGDLFDLFHGEYGRATIMYRSGQEATYQCRGRDLFGRRAPTQLT